MTDRTAEETRKRKTSPLSSAVTLAVCHSSSAGDEYSWKPELVMGRELSRVEVPDQVLTSYFITPSYHQALTTTVTSPGKDVC